MSLVPFDTLPDHARLWVFPADRPLDATETAALREAVEESLAGWSAHGSPVRWGYTIVHDQFLAVGVDETHTALSGCSIDSCTRRIRALEERLGVGFLDNGRVFYRDGGAVAWRSRPDFRALAEAGTVTLDTPVFNTILPTVGEFRAGGWEVPARDAWHARAFPLGA